jgi:hypothetical protein
MPIKQGPFHETFSVPTTVHSSLLRTLLFILLVRFIKDSCRRLFQRTRSYKFPLDASCVLQCSTSHPRVSVCPEVHNSHLAYKSVYILTSSIFKAEKHERENSAHTLSASCGVLHYDDIPFPLRISYIPHV